MLVASRFFGYVALFGGKFLLVTLVVRNVIALVGSCSDIFARVALLFAAKQHVLGLADSGFADCLS